MKPIVFYGNLLLSGVLIGSRNSTSNPVRKVADGSINLPYTHTADTGPGLHSGSISVTLTSAQVPSTLVLPQCSIASGFTLLLQSMDDVFGTNTVNVISADFNSTTKFYKQDLPSGAAANLVWRVMLSGASGLVPAKVNEIQLATTKEQFARSHQVGVERGRVRQFTRTPIPGGQPFVKRDGPRLRRTGISLILVSGTEVNAVRDFVDAVEGGDAFTFTDDLGSSYWAELLGAEVIEDDQAGVSSWRLQFQEIKVDA